MTKVKDLLYTARWALTEAIEKDNFKALDLCVDNITTAKSLIADIDEPERPSAPSKEKEIELNKYELPKIVRVPGMKFNKHGKFKTKTGNAMGLVVHYTVSGRTASNAKNVLNYLAKKGLGCPVMDEDGIIYVPEDYNLQTDVVYHAGVSEWKGKSGISSYCIGMEICCWGLNSKLGPYRESKGEDNQKKGKYQQYTKAQENSLINFIKWQMDINPEFKTDWIVGHDEIAPTRKQDPGASLSMTMPEFRKLFS